MAVDIKLNQMIDAQNARLKSILLDDVELSVRTLNALKACGAVTLYDAQVALVNRTLHKQKGIGAKSVREVNEIIRYVLIDTTPAPEKSKHERRMERVIEMFLNWTGALAQVGSVTPDAWRELVVIRQEAEGALRND